jgi:hypothetical protein
MADDETKKDLGVTRPGVTRPGVTRPGDAEDGEDVEGHRIDLSKTAKERDSSGTEGSGDSKPRPVERMDV